MTNTYLKNVKGQDIYFDFEKVSGEFSKVAQNYAQLEIRTPKNSNLKTAMFNSELEIEGQKLNKSIEAILENKPKTKAEVNAVKIKSLLDRGILVKEELSDKYVEYLWCALNDKGHIQSSNKNVIKNLVEANDKSDTTPITEAIISSFYIYYMNHYGDLPVDNGQMSRLVLMHELICNGYQNFRFVNLMQQLKLYKKSYDMQLTVISKPSITDITSYIEFMLKMINMSLIMQTQLARTSISLTDSIIDNSLKRCYIMNEIMKNEHKVLNRKSYKKLWNSICDRYNEYSINEDTALGDLYELMKYDLIVPEYNMGYQGFKYWKY